MSLSLTIPPTESLALSRSLPSSGTALPNWPLIGVALLVGVTFLLTEHSLDISQIDAFTQTAEEMELAAAGGNLARRVLFLALAGMGMESGMVAVMLPPLLLACCLMKMALFADQQKFADSPEVRVSDAKSTARDAGVIA